jgi:hypothetical protein
MISWVRPLVELRVRDAVAFSGVSGMILNRFVARPALVMIGLVLMGVGSLAVFIEPARAQQGPPSNLPLSKSQGRSSVDPELVRAYDRSAPRSALHRTFALTVVDDETSRPLADSEVRIKNHIDSRHYAFQTDARGCLRFEYPSLHGEPSLSLEVRKNGYVPIGRGWGGNSGPPEGWTFRLRHGTTMGGIVVAAGERPVEGATVLMSVTGNGPGERPANPTGTEWFHKLPLRTGPDGRWRTESVPPGADKVEIQLIHPDFVSDGAPTLGFSSARSPSPADLRDQSDRQLLRKGVALEGLVVDDEGRPIVGARFEDSTRGLNSPELPWCHPTDAEGRFHIHLPPGNSLLLAARAEGYVTATQNVSPASDHPAIKFRLARGQRLRGRVVDSAGHPIEGARVFAAMVKPNQRGFFDAWSNENGRFDWDDAPAEAVQFRCTAEGYIDDEKCWLKAGNEVGDITLRPAIDVQIAAIDAQTREAVPRFHVQVGSRDRATNQFGWGPRMGRSAPRRFEIMLAAEEGPYEFEISADGYVPARFFVLRERTVLRKTIPLEKAAR